jgi:hypothetical protein
VVKFTRFSLKLEHLWCLTVIVGIFIFVNTHPIRPNDFWWHITVGKEILETQAIPSTDKYSYTMFGESYSSYQMFWLMEVFLYSLFSLGGPALIVLIQSLIITAAYTIIIYIIYRRTGSWRIAAVGGIFAAALGINDWNVRPQTITFLLASICLWAIYSYKQKSDWRYLLVLPFATLIWVNSHGTFPIGLILIGIWFADEVFNYLKGGREARGDNKDVLYSAIALIVSSLAMFVNPRGFGIFGYLKTMGANPVVQNLVVEWAPPTINSLLGGLFYAALILLAGLIVISPRKPDLFEILTFLIFAVLGIRTSRGVVWFGLVLAPIFAQHLHSISSRLGSNTSMNKSQESIIMNRMIGGFLLLLALISLPWFKDKLPLPAAKAGLISSETPVEATAFMLQERLPTQIFHAMSFGSYLIWAAQPAYRVFVDPRIELYTREQWLDYLSISNAQGNWEQMLRDYGVNTLMLSLGEQAQLVEEVRRSDQWNSLYKDNIVEIYVRVDFATAGADFTFQSSKFSACSFSSWGLMNDRINSPRKIYLFPSSLYPRF